VIPQATGYHERRLFYPPGPVRPDRLPGRLGPHAVGGLRVEPLLGVVGHGRVEVVHGPPQGGGREPELPGEFLDRAGLDRGAGAVAGLQQRYRLLVEDLEGDPGRLRPDGGAGLGVGEPDLILALVDEAFGVDVDHDAVREGVAAVLVGHLQVTDGRRARVDGGRVAALPVPHRLGPGRHRRGQHRAHVEPGAADLDHVPALAEVAGAHLRVRLEPTGRQHDHAGHLDDLVAGPDQDAVDPRP